MSQGTLILHRGGAIATREQVAEVEAPSATDTWHPVPHIQVLEKVETLLYDAGYSINREQLSLAGNGAKFFGVIDLESRISEGVSLAIGLRNSIDKSFPYGIAGGTRTFVCDNLALTGDWDELTISRKHTRHGNQRFAEALANGIGKLSQYRDMESKRIEILRATDVSDDMAYSLFMRAYERNLLSDRVIRDCLKQWNEPDFDWGDKTLYRLYNAMNTPLQSKAASNPRAFAYQTMKLMELIAPKGNDGSGEAGVIDITPSDN